MDGAGHDDGDAIRCRTAGAAAGRAGAESVAAPEDVSAPVDVDVNLVVGVTMIVMAALFIGWALWRPLGRELERAADD